MKAPLIATLVLTLGLLTGAGATAETLVIADADRRPAEQTYLTVPEWFLVFSPEEYASYLGSGAAPSEFPFWGHIRQFWRSYAAVSAASAEHYPINWGYHVMVLVIGTSTTLEYGLKSAYEILIGRLAELTRRGPAVAEERLAAEVARDYVSFILTAPWYEFDFAARLEELWRTTPWWGADPVRKWERRYVLTSEYAAKAAYAWLIGTLTRLGYAPPSPHTAVIVRDMPAVATRLLPQLEVLREDGAGRSLIRVPRYAPFASHARKLAQLGAEFENIAGNRGAILVSVLHRDADLAQRYAARTLYTQPILTRTGVSRLVLVIEVPELATTLRDLERAGVEIEHIYDY